LLIETIEAYSQPCTAADGFKLVLSLKGYMHYASNIALQWRIQEFKEGGSFKRVRAERTDKFMVTKPTLPNHAQFN